MAVGSIFGVHENAWPLGFLPGPGTAGKEPVVVVAVSAEGVEGLTGGLWGLDSEENTGLWL